jgi:peptide/nickel transport system permease protein
MVIRYALRRLVLLVPVLFGVTLVTFLLVHLTPGDPIQVMLGETYDETHAAELRQELGLDAPLPVQYVVWLGRLARGDLGHSILTKDPVLKLIGDRLPLTLELAGLSMIVALAVALPVGVLSATRRNGVFDSVARVASTIAIAVPVFWSGIMLILVFGLQLGWLPAGGGPSLFGYKALILPSLVLGLANAALLTRMTRAAMLEVLSEQYMTTARAKGLAPHVVYGRHAMRNALIPIITVIGLEFGTLLGGAVLTEQIFSLPGLGSLLIDSIYRRDFPIIQGATLIVALGLMLVTLLVDLAYAVVDPRIRY